MKGLFAKDFALLKQRGKILFFLLAWSIVMYFVMDDSSYVVGWVGMIALITAISTISYDEYDNCMPFLMCLPVTRRGYALEKYLFALTCGTVFWFFSLLIVIILGLITNNPFSFSEDFPGMIAIFAMTLLVMAVTIPPQLKWGAEKGRTIMFVFFGVVMVGALLLSRLTDSLAKAAETLDSLSMPGVLAGFFALCVLLTAGSLLISMRIMEKKEY